VHGREWTPLDHCWQIPFLSVIKNKKDVRRCRIFAQFAEQLIPQWLMEKVPLLWQRAWGKCEGLGVGEQGAFGEPVDLCKAPDGAYLFSINNPRKFMNGKNGN
jgi:hypothetical protein